MNYITIKIRKPLFENFVYIRDKYINQAIAQNKQLEIITPDGRGIHDPYKWRNTGKPMFKEFKIPGQPMTLFGNFVRYITEEDDLQELSRQCL